jgi:citrate synthase
MAAESEDIVGALKERLRALIQEKRERIAGVRADYGGAVLGKVTVDQLFGGARDIKCLVYETSLLDKEGILLRGWSVFELRDKLPKVRFILLVASMDQADGSPSQVDSEPLPEGLLWLLLTGEIPSQQQVTHLSQALASRSLVPDWILLMIRSLPKARLLSPFCFLPLQL